MSLWILVTVVLGLAYENVSAFDGSFGPLLGIMSLLVWAYLTGVAVLYGLAFAAELESERAGRMRRGEEPIPEDRERRVHV